MEEVIEEVLEEVMVEVMVEVLEEVMEEVMRSSQSLKSDRSKDKPPNFREDGPEDQRFRLYNMEPRGSGPGSKPRPGPGPAPSSVSVKSDESRNLPPLFREDGPEDQRDPGPKEPLDAILRRLQEDVVTFVKEQLQRIQRLLASDYPECSESEVQSREVLNIALDFLRRMKQEQLVQRLQSNSDLQDFDLRKYRASETALLGLLPVVRASTKALLRECGLSPHSCGPLASVLSSSSLTHLDLSNNDLQDSGVELLCSGLKSAPCGLHTLRLSGCLISERGEAALASALSPAPSHLRELDLSYNHPGDPNRTALVIEEASWTSTTATAPTVLLYFPHPTTIMATEQELRDLVQQLQARPPSLTANSEFTELRQLLEKQQEQLNQLTQGLLALQTAPRPPVRRPNTLLCLRCQKPGHFARECDNERFIPQARPQHVATTSALQEAGNFNPLV
uniref:CCHC-type domain-containing protein n=1 Tax=Knipowitschia caucasica TaxID=637954 RepID=A0AAV2JHI6_KNICA